MSLSFCDVWFYTYNFSYSLHSCVILFENIWNDCVFAKYHWCNWVPLGNVFHGIMDGKVRLIYYSYVISPPSKRQCWKVTIQANSGSIIFRSLHIYMFDFSTLLSCFEVIDRRPLWWANTRSLLSCSFSIITECFLLIW